MRSDQAAPAQPFGGMIGFTLVWVGQLVSVLASNMSGFALTIWAYQQTGSATTLGLISACFTVPFILVSPIAGAMVDRNDRKPMMMVSDLGAVLATGAILVLKATGRLAIWQAKVAPDIQGRVFAARRMLARMVDPVMPVVSGLIADRVMEPAMRSPRGWRGPSRASPARVPARGWRYSSSPRGCCTS
jgi:MFS family permease